MNLNKKVSYTYHDIKSYILQLMNSIGCSEQATNCGKSSPTIKEMLDSLYI